MPIGGDSAAGQKMLDFVKYEVGIEDELPQVISRLQMLWKNLLTQVQLHDLPKIEMEAGMSPYILNGYLLMMLSCLWRILFQPPHCYGPQTPISTRWRPSCRW